MKSRMAAVVIVLGAFTCPVLAAIVVALAGGKPEDVAMTFMLGVFTTGMFAVLPVVILTE